MTFQKGDRVILVSSRYGVTKNNPVEGSSFACKGTVREVRGLVGWIPAGQSCIVNWDNGTTNSYTADTLQKVETSEQASFKSVW